MGHWWRAVVFAALLSASSCGQTSPAIDTSATPADEIAVTPQNAADLIFCEEIGRRVPRADCVDFTHLAQSAQAGVAAFNAPDPMQRGETRTVQLAISYAPPPPVELAPPPSEQIEAAREEAASEASAALEAARQEAEREAEQARREAASQHAQNEGVPDEGTPSPPPPPGDVDETPAPGPPSPAPSDTREGESHASSPPPPLQTPAEVVENLPGDTMQFTPLVGRFMKAELTGVGFDITPLSQATQEVAKDSVTTWTWRVVAHESGVRSLTLTTVVQGCPVSGPCVPLRTTTQNYTVNVSVGPLDQVRDVLMSLPDWLKIIAAIVVALTSVIAAFFGLRAAIRKGRKPA